MFGKISNRLIFLSVLSLILSFSASSKAQNYADAGLLTHQKGIVNLVIEDNKRKMLSKGDGINGGDIIITEADSHARIQFSDGSNLIMLPNSKIELLHYHFESDNVQNDKIAINLIKGAIRSITGTIGKRSPKRHLLKTKNANFSVRGTHLGLFSCSSISECSDLKTLAGNTPDAGVYLDVFEGAVLVNNAGGDLLVEAGKFAKVKDAKSKPQLLGENMAVRVPVLPSLVNEQSEADCFH